MSFGSFRKLIVILETQSPNLPPEETYLPFRRPFVEVHVFLSKYSMTFPDLKNNPMSKKLFNNSCNVTGKGSISYFTRYSFIYYPYRLILIFKEEQLVGRSGRLKQKGGNGRTSFQTYSQDQ